MHNKNLANQRVWLTGASSGIGYQLAKALLAEGCQLLVSGRDVAKLESLQAYGKEGQCHVYAFDVLDQTAYPGLVNVLEHKLGGVDKVIFNAGDCQYVDIKNFNAAPFRAMLETNVMSMVYGLEAVLPLLRQSPMPHIVAMSSTAAYRALPRAAAYGCSKAAIYYLFESLRLDLFPEKISVSIVCPGFVKTPLTDRNDFSMPGIISPAEAADYIVKGIKKYSYEINFPKRFSLFLKLLKILPTSWHLKLMQKLVRT